MLDISTCHGNCETCSVKRTVVDIRENSMTRSVSMTEEVQAVPMMVQEEVVQEVAQEETLPAVIEISETPVVYTVSKKRNGLVGKLVGGK